MTETDPFKILNLPDTASPVEVKEAYWQLAKQAHPDAGGSVEAFNALKSAYQEATSLAIQTKCHACKGDGKIRTQLGFSSLELSCFECNGTGKKY